MKVLVTGGAGFIGSHVIEELINYNFQVVSVDSYVTGSPFNVPEGVMMYEMDINHHGLESIFLKEKPDFVIHLAAQVSVIGSINNPYEDFYTNTAGTVNLLRLSTKYHVKKFLFASTAAVYGEPNYLPVDEIHPIETKSFYALSKFSAENYIHQYGQLNNLDCCVFRFSNVYGPRQNANGEAGVVAIFVNGLLNNERVAIYGGNQTRDFIHVKDIAKACHLALVRQVVGVFNLSSGTETTITDLFKQIAEIARVSKKPIYFPERNSEIQQSVLDNQKAYRVFDWKPKIQLSDGLLETVQYYAGLSSFELQR